MILRTCLVKFIESWEWEVETQIWGNNETILRSDFGYAWRIIHGSNMIFHHQAGRTMQLDIPSCLIKVDASSMLFKLDIMLHQVRPCLISTFIKHGGSSTLIKHDTSTVNNIDIKHEEDIMMSTKYNTNTDQAGQLNHDKVWHQPRSIMLARQPWSSMIHINHIHRPQHWYQAWTRLMSTTIKLYNHFEQPSYHYAFSI